MANISENEFKLQSELHIPDSKILHDFAILRMSKMEYFPGTDHELLVLYNQTVSDLVEFYNDYTRNK